MAKKSVARKAQNFALEKEGIIRTTTVKTTMAVILVKYVTCHIGAQHIVFRR